MKKLLLFVCILIISNSFAQKNTTISQALNIASKQSMLCERLAKEKIFKATYPTNFNVEKKLIVSLIQFERNISILKSFNLPENILATVEKASTLWADYRENLLDNNYEKTIKTIEYNNVMYSLCEEVFTEILKYAKTDELYPYNNSIEYFPEAYIASNKIKKMSQRFSLFYNAYYSKVIEYNQDNFNLIISELDGSISSINKLKNSNDDIKTKTLKVENEWKALRNSIKEIIESDFSYNEKYPKPEQILMQTNELLKDADLLTRLYKEQNDINKK